MPFLNCPVGKVEIHVLLPQYLSCTSTVRIKLSESEAIPPLVFVQ